MIRRVTEALFVALMIACVAGCSSSGNGNSGAATINGSISVTSTPAGAEIWLDGVDTGNASPATLDDVAAGDHTVLLKLTGYADAQQTVTVAAGETASVDLTLTAIAPSAPANLLSVGSLGHIVLTWDASTGDGLQGYNVYRSADGGTTFTLLNDTPVTAATYDDAIASPDGDGVFYTYKVTAVGTAESDASATVRNMHGTRITGTYNTPGFTTDPAFSPYVLESTVTIDSGNFTVDTGTELYVLDNSVIDLAAAAANDLANGQFIVKGLLRVVADASAPATFTSHKAGGLANGEGFTLVFNGAPDYNAADDSGTLLRNVDIQNLRDRQSSVHDVIQLGTSAPKFENSKISVNHQTEATLFNVTTGVIFTHCSITGIYPNIHAVLSGTTFSIDHSILAPGAFNYTLDFSNVTDPLASGQIINNSIDWNPGDQIDLFVVGGTHAGGNDIPLENNYWTNGTPTFRYQGGTNVTLVCIFAPQLSAAPADVGPVGW